MYIDRTYMIINCPLARAYRIQTGVQVYLLSPLPAPAPCILSPGDKIPRGILPPPLGYLSSVSKYRSYGILSPGTRHRSHGILSPLLFRYASLVKIHP